MCKSFHNHATDEGNPRVHAELGRLIGHALVSATEPSRAKLSPRLRQTLACLLEGDSEKQVAPRLSLKCELEVA